MPRLLSGSTLRRGGSGEFLDLRGAMPQLPPSETTATGFTIVTDELYRTSYRSSLGFIEFKTATMYSSLPEGTIRILATGTTFYSTSTLTGNLVVEGGIGVGGNMNIYEDIVVNGITIGRGFEGVNNIVIRGDASPQIDSFNNGQESIAIGYDALKQGLNTSFRNIALGRYALSSGTDFANNIAIGDKTLQNLGYTATIFLATITAATQTTPVVLTAENHGLMSGTQIRIFDVNGMIELNNADFYISVLSSSTIGLYYDVILASPTTGTLFTSYISGGTINHIVLKSNNVAIGNDSGSSLIDGEKNFFLGDSSARYFTTGSGNLFIGHEVATNIVNGSYNISIGGDNLIDGRDDQVNIGSVFYYDGLGKLQLNSDTEIGVGSTATINTPGVVETTSTFSAALIVVGGAGITRNLIVGDTVQIFDDTESTDITSGALTVSGGVGIKQSLNVGYELNVVGTGSVVLSPINASVSIQPTNAIGVIDNMVIGSLSPQDGTFVDVRVNSTATSTSTTTGALTVVGGIGTLGSIYSADGIPDENYLLRTPRITVGATPPVNPKVGDVWVYPDINGYLQWIKDGSSTFWIQLLSI